MSVTGEDAVRGMGEVAKMAGDITVGKLAGKLTDEDAETLVTAMGLVTPWLLNTPDRFALLHGDYRLDNLLFDGERITVVDWQTMGVRDWPVATWRISPAPAWSPTCARVDADLVGDYHQALLDQGVTGYDLRPVGMTTPLGMIQVPLISALGCAFSIETERGDDMMAAMLRRGCQAIRDLGTPRSRRRRVGAPHGREPAPHRDHRRRHQRADVRQDAQDYGVPYTIVRVVRPHRRQLGVREPERPVQRLPLAAHRHLERTVVVQDFPIPEHFPSFPHHSDIKAYLDSYADAFGLLENIEFNNGVRHAGLRPDGRWDITDQQGSTREFDLLVVGNGHHWDARYPDFPGEFTGETIHSHHYIDPQTH